MHGNIVKTSARNLRQTYIQQYLKSFLRRVHPDLFQGHPKEQLRNSTSLQDLLPVINYEKTKQADTPLIHSSNNRETKPTKLVFYFKNKDPADRSKDAPGQNGLESAEHLLPDLHPTVSSVKDDVGYSATTMTLEQEIRSWQMVQSFMELCRKVGVSVKDGDQQDVALNLEQAVQKVSALDRSRHSQAPQKPLSEVFEEELKEAFAGSGVAAGGEVMGEMDFGKAGAVPLALDAQMMIESNPLLFRSPTLPVNRLRKTVRTWIYWQEEDRQLAGSSVESGAQSMPFRLSDWWRKVPIMVLSSAKERSAMLQRTSTSGDSQGMGILVVDQDMSKQEADLAPLLEWCRGWSHSFARKLE
ncbi:hypothetical protein B0O80DRAFT_421674 [Mortierella sp. GBAus27b]|nr:hypothetical protein B0O80DRAFT_421674 [Mortierella sp. GBAus27b]